MQVGIALEFLARLDEIRPAREHLETQALTVETRQDLALFDCFAFFHEQFDDVTCDGLDDDCDGVADEDYVPTATTCGVGACTGNAGQLECQAGSLVDTWDPLAGAAEFTAEVILLSISLRG